MRHWVTVFNKTGGVAKRTCSGRKPTINDAVVDAATKMLESGDYAGTKHVAAHLRKNKAFRLVTHVYRTTLARAVKAKCQKEGAPFLVVSGEPAKELSPQNMKRRSDFSKRHKHTNWRATMFSDAKKFWFRYPGICVHRYSRARKGKKWQVPKASHPMAFQLYAWITRLGITKPHFVPGTHGKKTKHKRVDGKEARGTTKREYKEVLEKTLLPEGNRIFKSVGIKGWVFQQDRCSSHSGASSVIQAWSHKQHGVQVNLPQGWPGNSPDMNPIENLWSWVQGKANAKGCNTHAAFKRCLVKTLKNIPKEMLEHLVDSMENMLQACIEDNGGNNKYQSISCKKAFPLWEQMFGR